MKENENLPKFKTRHTEKGVLIFDALRKKYIPLTPEEDVRQHFVHYLVNVLKYPAGLMGNEVAIMQNGIRRRCDTVVFDHSGNPVMIVEYKAPSVNLTQQVFDQIYRYNMVLQVKYLVVTNGLSLYCCRMNYKENKYEFISELPSHEKLSELNP